MSLKLHFDSNQQYQLRAIESVIQLFEGQPVSSGDFEFSFDESDNSFGYESLGFGNRPGMGFDQIIANLRKVQKENNIPEKFMENDDAVRNHGMNFSVEMETGTGKTYVYLRSIYELNKTYGFTKFVIVVPSIAIREGVLKNLQITHEHFQTLYDRTPVNFFVYDSKKISALRSFATSNTLQIMVINIDSFAKDTTVINIENDKLSGRKPVEFVNSVNPIVIVDEPQNMETEIRKKAIESLNPLCTLRYSATHKNHYNLIYRLDPVRAYDLGLVKQIEVDSICEVNANNFAFINLKRINSNNNLSATLDIDVNVDDGVKRRSLSVKVGDDLFEKSNGRELYRDGFILSEIDSVNGAIKFVNGISLDTGQTQGEYTDDLMKYQMRKTIISHLKKERKLKELGIKVLSLFFIDKVANYRSYDESGNEVRGKFSLWFEEIYEEETSKAEFIQLAVPDIPIIHNGYFSQDKSGKLKDTSGETKADDDIYQLIMRDKEKLLSLENPLRFIFSHSALREGWDNPNVFQICTLNETRSELKKRQEIGRGMRLPVDKSGMRILDKQINRLTVVANESYEDFAKQLQKEIEDDCNVEFGNRVKNANKPAKVKLRDNFELDPGFKELWDRINAKTIYRIDLDSKEIIDNASASISAMEAIKAPKLISTTAQIEMSAQGVQTILTGTNLPVETETTGFPIPDLAGYIQDRTDLSRTTINKILRKSGRLGESILNPQLFADRCVYEIKKVLSRTLLSGIKYERIEGAQYHVSLFKKEIDSYESNVKDILNKKKSIYDKIVIDSEVESKFAGDCDSNENIEFFIKLPKWFEIQTPIGIYNPDWAMIFKDETKIYFVAETKGTKDDDNLRVSEKLKIEYGKKHFEEFDGINFKVANGLEDLLRDE